MASWAAISLAEVGPFRGPLGGEDLDGWQISLAGAGVVLYAVAAVRYYRLFRLRRAAFLLVVALAFALLAEGMLVIAWARSWRVSWWEWHLLMLVAFAAIAASARTEWHEERFSPLYLDGRSRARARSACSSPTSRASRRSRRRRRRRAWRRCSTATSGGSCRCSRRGRRGAPDRRRRRDGDLQPGRRPARPRGPGRPHRARVSGGRRRDRGRASGVAPLPCRG